MVLREKISFTVNLGDLKASCKAVLYFKEKNTRKIAPKPCSFTIAIYVKALSNGEWFGGWAPVRARLEWVRADGEAALFTITEVGLEEGDEYEFYLPNTLVIATMEEGGLAG